LPALLFEIHGALAQAKLGFTASSRTMVANLL